jgi:hypothetical protein
MAMTNAERARFARINRLLARAGEGNTLGRARPNGGGFAPYFVSDADGDTLYSVRDLDAPERELRAGETEYSLLTAG